MLSFVLAILVFLLGMKGFRKEGIPLTRSRNITGRKGKLIGGACIAFGLALCVDGFLGTAGLISRLSQRAMSMRSPFFTNAPNRPIGADHVMPHFRDDVGLSTPSRAWNPELDVAVDACDESLNTHELAGAWRIVSSEAAGMVFNVAGKYEFDGNRLVIEEGTYNVVRTIELDPDSDPKRLDSRQGSGNEEGVFRAIYRLEGDLLTISDAAPFEPRPDSFVERTSPDDDYTLVVLERIR